MIGANVIELVLELRNQVRAVGGRAEVLLVHPGTHRTHLGSATEIAGMRVEVREWANDGELLVLSRFDFESRDAEPPAASSTASAFSPFSPTNIPSLKS
jgi:hypothetical protein